MSEGTSLIEVVFARDPVTHAMVVHLELMYLSAEQRPEAQNPRRWAMGAAGAAMAALVIGRRLGRRRHRRG
ncbi:hypothetical protein [Agromyces bauzanensis]